MRMRAVYYLFVVFTRAFSLMPLRLLYVLSDCLCILFTSVIPYRRKVIASNIDNSFPDWPEEKRRQIVKGFYRNLSDILVEGLKGVSMSKEELTTRYRFTNPEVMNEYFDRGQDVVSVGAHYANWEWGIIAAPAQLRHTIFAFYTPLANKLIDNEMRSSRRKFGTELVPRTEVRSAFTAAREKPATYFFGADQSPPKPAGAHWMRFLNQDTACMKGPEFFAKHYNLPVVYFDVQRVKRGYYTVTLSVLEAHPDKTSGGEITEKYMRKLEETVIRKPEDYLWSHRKWKHKRPATTAVRPANQPA